MKDAFRPIADPVPCVHIGLPKTATTMLQKVYFPHHPQIAFLGKWQHGGLPDNGKWRGPEISNLIQRLSRLGPKRNRTRGREIVQQHVVPEMEAGRVPLLSQEAWSVMSRKARRMRAENMRDAFGECKIMITLRHPVREMESAYLEDIKRHNLTDLRSFGDPPWYQTVDEWLQSQWDRWEPPVAPFPHCDYMHTIETYADVLGRDAVGVFLFEDLKKDMAGFLRSIARFAGVDPEAVVDSANGTVVHGRLREANVRRLLAIKASPVHSLVYRLSCDSMRQRMLGVHLSKAEGGQPIRADMSEDWRDKIAELTRQGNRRLQDEWGLPLEQYGYPM